MAQSDQPKPRKNTIPTHVYHCRSDVRERETEKLAEEIQYHFGKKCSDRFSQNKVAISRV